MNFDLEIYLLGTKKFIVEYKDCCSWILINN